MENFGRGRGSSGGRGRGRNYRPNFSLGRGRGASDGNGGRAGGEGRSNFEQHVPSQPRVSEVASDALVPDLHSLNISQTSLPSPPPEVGDRIQAKRPDNGGEASIRPVRLLVNHFPVHFNSERTIFHYDIDIKPEVPPKHGGTVRLPKADMLLIKDKFFSDDPVQFPMAMTAYDGGKNIVSAVELPTGTFKVEVSKGDDLGTRAYIFTINLVKKLELCRLVDYFNGTLSSNPRKILQGMDLVLKEIPSRHYIPVGRGFYPKGLGDDLGYGIIASKGFQHSLKCTSQDLVLCVDYSVLAFRKAVPVLDFLIEHLPGIYGRPFDNQVRKDAEEVLKGLRVMVTHRATTQKFTIVGLTKHVSKNLTFTVEDLDGNNPPREVGLVDYYREKYQKEIQYKNLPCLDLSKNKKTNYVPMEFCVLVEGQRYPKELLDMDREMAKRYKEIALAKPQNRMEVIHDMIRAEDGPRGGEVAGNFDISVSTEMTEVTGRVIAQPDLKLGTVNGKPCKFTIDTDNRQWNLRDRSLVEGKQIKCWAILDFSSSDQYKKLMTDHFTQMLINRCHKLGIYMEWPLFCQPSNMGMLSNADQLRHLLKTVYDCAGGQLQLLVCVMTKRDPGYKRLKWICETEIGLVTQCCLSGNANMAKDDHLANIALKINAKLGGSNFELFEGLPRLKGNGHVMFVGADVNHPGPKNASSPSVAAVVATVNWPAANRYAACLRLQDHRMEKIKDFGMMCMELVNLYAQVNKVKPEKIVVFRDGVSESQFDMVVNDELTDLKKAIGSDGYFPTITLVVAQKRHKTRLFPKDERQGGRTGNVAPGTVVDTKIVSNWGFDFYLCSHYGSRGTSKPTHYHVLWDELGFTSDELQLLVYNLCYTYPTCTKPISLVPPAYYADRVAYRGQQYHEAMMESRERDSTSSSSSNSFSLASSSLSEDMTFVMLHNDLEKFMVFL